MLSIFLITKITSNYLDYFSSNFWQILDGSLTKFL